MHKPCPDEVVFALLALGDGRINFPSRLSSLASRPTQFDVTPSTSAKAALLLCLAEYETLQHLHTDASFYQLLYFLALVSDTEGRLQKGLGYITRAQQLQDALPSGSVLCTATAAAWSYSRACW